MAPTALATPSVDEVFDLDLRMEIGAPLTPISGKYTDSCTSNCNTAERSTCMRTCGGMTGQPCAC